MFACPPQGMDADAFEKKFNTLEVHLVRSQQLFCRDVLKLSPGQRAVVSNGRVRHRTHTHTRARTRSLPPAPQTDPTELIHSAVLTVSESCSDIITTHCVRPHAHPGGKLGL